MVPLRKSWHQDSDPSGVGAEPLVSCPALWPQPCFNESLWAPHLSFVQPGLPTDTPTKRLSPPHISLNNPACSWCFMGTGPRTLAMRLCRRGQKSHPLILQTDEPWPTLGRMLVQSHPASPGQVGPGPRAGLSLLLCPPAPRTLQHMVASPAQMPRDQVINKSLIYVINRKIDASTSQTPTEPPGVGGGVKGQKKCRALPSLPLKLNEGDQGAKPGPSINRSAPLNIPHPPTSLPLLLPPQSSTTISHLDSAGALPRPLLIPCPQSSQSGTF